MNYAIDKVVKEEYPEIMEVWEASVHTTHDFLHEGFREVDRSEVDALGKPYSVLHLELIE